MVVIFSVILNFIKSPASLSKSVEIDFFFFILEFYRVQNLMNLSKLVNLIDQKLWIYQKLYHPKDGLNSYFALLNSAKPYIRRRT